MAEMENHEPKMVRGLAGYALGRWQQAHCNGEILKGCSKEATPTPAVLDAGSSLNQTHFSCSFPPES
jgi:hypothetical protein